MGKGNKSYSCGDINICTKCHLCDKIFKCRDKRQFDKHLQLHLKLNHPAFIHIPNRDDFKYAHRTNFSNTSNNAFTEQVIKHERITTNKERPIFDALQLIDKTAK